MSTAPVPNYTRVADWLARGGQPEAEGFEFLARSGFKTIVNLRESHDRLPRGCEDLRVVHLPVKNHHAPSIEQVHEWMHLLEDRATHPIYFHCHHGRGRTSVFFGLVRIAQGDEIDEVIEEEMRVYEMPESEREQVEFLRDVAGKVQRGELHLPKLPQFISQPARPG